MKGGQTPSGYTIIEVMIVLAVSAFMLVIAGSFVNGKQQQASFDSGVKELVARIQDTTEEVANGQYSDIQLQCTRATPKVQVSLGTNQQGKNSECVFMGKMLHFSLGGDATKYEVIPIVGSRLNVDDTTKPATTPEEARIAAVGDLAVTQTVPSNLEVYRIIADGVTHSALRTYNFGILFLQDLGSLDTASGDATYNPGAQLTPRIHKIGAIRNNLSSADAVALVRGDYLGYTTSIVICVKDGTRFAQLKFGEGGTSRASTNVEVSNISRTESAPCSS